MRRTYVGPSRVRSGHLASLGVALALFVGTATALSGCIVAPAPAPVYYAPAPVYYAPAPVVVAPAPVVGSRHWGWRRW